MGYITYFRETGTGLTNAGHIQANGTDIVVNQNSYPNVIDWNEDGRKDLVIGEFSGTTRLYLNSGTNSAPVFTTYSLLAAGGNPINWYKANPTVHDLDADGKKDLIVGYADGFLIFYKNVGTNAAPAFTSHDTLKTRSGAKIQIALGASRSRFVDWKGDGDLDMIVGGYEGNVQYFENTRNDIAEGIAAGLAKGLSISPNPATRRTTLDYSLAQPARVQINIYSVNGCRVASPVNRSLASGTQRLIWDLNDDSGRPLPAGIYFVELGVGADKATTRVVIAR